MSQVFRLRPYASLVFAMLAAVLASGAWGAEPAKAGEGSDQYRQLDRLLEQANRKAAAGATRLEVEAWLTASLRLLGMQPEAPAEAERAPKLAARWDVYGRPRQDVFQDKGVGAPKAGPVLADNAAEVLPINELSSEEDTGTYPINGARPDLDTGAGRYPSGVNSSGEPGNVHQPHQERGSVPVRLALPPTGRDL